ncbi:hypothetical protein BDW67DRAFT_111132 [Aspergillus spinulosporus]
MVKEPVGRQHPAGTPVIPGLVFLVGINILHPTCSISNGPGQAQWAKPQLPSSGQAGISGRVEGEGEG